MVIRRVVILLKCMTRSYMLQHFVVSVCSKPLHTADSETVSQIVYCFGEMDFKKFHVQVLKTKVLGLNF